MTTAIFTHRKWINCSTVLLYRDVYFLVLWSTTDWKTGVRSPAEAKDFSSSVSRPALRPTQPPIQRVPGVVSPRVKRLVPRSKISRNYTSPSLWRQHDLVGHFCFTFTFLWMVIKQRTVAGKHYFKHPHFKRFIFMEYPFKLGWRDHSNDCENWWWIKQPSRP
jgi:hypothetical protein